MKTKQKLFYMECHLAGRKFHDVDDVWDDLKVGLKLRLEREPDNRYDPEAIAVVYSRENACGDIEEFMLGYIPSDENEDLAKFLDMGWGGIFECCISRIDPQAYYEKQIFLSIKIKRNIG